jgi:hypothetical protein
MQLPTMQKGASQDSAKGTEARLRNWHRNFESARLVCRYEPWRWARGDRAALPLRRECPVAPPMWLSPSPPTDDGWFLPAGWLRLLCRVDRWLDCLSLTRRQVENPQAVLVVDPTWRPLWVWADWSNSTAAATVNSRWGKVYLSDTPG